MWKRCYEPSSSDDEGSARKRPCIADTTVGTSDATQPVIAGTIAASSDATQQMIADTVVGTSDATQMGRASVHVGNASDAPPSANASTIHSAGPLDDWIELLNLGEDPEPPAVTPVPVLRPADMRASEFFSEWRAREHAREPSPMSEHSDEASTGVESTTASPTSDTESAHTSNASTYVDPDTIPEDLSARCYAGIEIGLERCYLSDYICVDYIRADGTSYELALSHSRSMVQSLVYEGRPHYIGITRDPLHRHIFASYAHRKKGWTEMNVILAASIPMCRRVETQLIKDSRCGEGPRGSTNKAKGGETPPVDCEHCFVYVVT